MKYDIAIMGGGPAGYTAAERASKYGVTNEAEPVADLAKIISRKKKVVHKLVAGIAINRQYTIEEFRKEVYLHPSVGEILHKILY